MPCNCYRPVTAAKSEPEFCSRECLASIGKGFLGFAAAAAALISVCCDSPAFAESLTVAFPVSRAREVIGYVYFWCLFNSRVLVWALMGFHLLLFV